MLDGKAIRVRGAGRSACGAQQRLPVAATSASVCAPRCIPACERGGLEISYPRQEKLRRGSSPPSPSTGARTRCLLLLGSNATFIQSGL